MTDEKSYNLSRDWEVINLSEKIKRYVLKGEDNARVELLNQIIEGEDLAEALCYLKLEFVEYYEEKIEKKENKQIDEILKNLERIVQGKNGKIINEIKEKILNQYVTIK